MTPRLSGADDIDGGRLQGDIKAIRASKTHHIGDIIAILHLILHILSRLLMCCGNQRAQYEAPLMKLTVANRRCERDVTFQNNAATIYNITISFDASC